jgi:hypothetical protein
LSTLQDEPLLLTHCAHAHCLQFEHSGNGLMSHIRETSKVTINTSYFHPAHQHYTDEAQKAETVPSVVIYIYIYMEKRSYCCKDLYYTINGLIYELIPAISNLAISNITVEHLYQLSISV